MRCLAPRQMRGQVALEFMIVLSAVLLIFIFSVFIYFQNISQSNQIQSKLAASQICIQVASTISSFAALEGNSSYTFRLPEEINYRNYSIWVVSGNHKVSVDYLVGAKREPGSACSMQATNITNSTGSYSFGLEKNATMQINGGRITVRP
jgi:uncharacterized protein (UPF0333 family)